MKSGTSSLNPYAASYVPLSKRNETIWLGSPSKTATQTQHQSKIHEAEEAVAKFQNAHGSCGSSSQSHMSEKQHTLDEEFDMNLAYLQMTFPGVSDQSLTDVYLVNNGDMETTVDMLSQLEGYTVENLPDSLDIGDVSESGSLAECGSLKMKEVAAGGSSSGSKDSAAIVT